MYTGFYEYKGDILKWSPNKEYFLKMTGWDDKNPDRRILSCEIKEDKLVKITRAKALEKINTIWNSGSREWTFQGEVYSNEIPVEKSPYHKFTHTWTQSQRYVYDKENDRQYYETLETPIEHSYDNCYKIVWHQGKVYWALIGQYFPQIQLAEIEAIDKEPHNCVKWTNINNCRGIINIKTGEPV